MERGNTPTPPLLELTSGRSSPPAACAICLGQFKNKSFAENCLHQFCFECLLKWSKIKAECPLCKQPFRHIMYNIRSNDSYDKYTVETPEEAVESEIEPYFSPRFRYRTTLTLLARDNYAVQRLLLEYPHLPHHQHSQLRVDTVYPHRNPRGSIYRNNLWADPTPDVTGRFRDCSPQFYRDNPAQVDRLTGWLNRELRLLITDPNTFVMALNAINDLVRTYPIMSREFRERIVEYIPNHTNHFIHEFFSFARSPYDMRGYDREVSYPRHGPRYYYNHVNEISSSSDRDSTDSDVFLVSPAPSNFANLRYMRMPDSNRPAPSTNRNVNNLSDPVVIETVSHFDTDSSSGDVEMVRYIKPPQDRTPEVVDLIASDSDAVIIEEGVRESSPPWEPQIQPVPSTSGVGKFFPKSRPILLSDTDSDDSGKRYSKEKSKYLRSRYIKNVDAMRHTDESSGSDSSSSSGASPIKNPIESNRTEDNVSGTVEMCDNHAENRASSSTTTAHERYKRRKSKKSKNKEISKKSRHNLKRKHKKSKKRHRSKDKYGGGAEKVSYKGKSSAGGKSKGKSAQPNHPDGFWPKSAQEDGAPSTSAHGEKRVLKSVVNPVACAVAPAAETTARKVRLPSAEWSASLSSEDDTPPRRPNMFGEVYHRCHNTPLDLRMREMYGGDRGE